LRVLYAKVEDKSADSRNVRSPGFPGFLRIKEIVPWFKSSYQLRRDDKKQTKIPVSRAQTKRLRELFGL
jgi:hypothetical protein